jgi:O-antigen/teichoic acid export membrane protein
VTTWVGIFSTFGYLSLGQVALHRAASQEGDAWFSATFGALLFYAGITTLLGWAIAFMCYLPSGGRLFHGLSTANLILGFLALPFLIWEQNGSSLLMAINKLSLYNYAQIIGRTVALFLIAIFIVGLHWGVNGALLAIFIAQVIIACVGMKLLFAKSENIRLWDSQTLKGLLADGLKLHLNAIGTFLFTNANILMVQYYKGVEQTGYFQFAVQLCGILLIIPQSASMVLYTYISKSGANNAWIINKRILISLTLGMGAIAILSALVIPSIIPFVVGDKFTPSIAVFNILLLTLIGQTFSTIMAPQWICRGLFYQASLITLSVGIFSVAVNYLLIPAYGMHGAAWASVVTYTISAIINLGMAIWVNRQVETVPKAPVW